MALASGHVVETVAFCVSFERGKYQARRAEISLNRYLGTQEIESILCTASQAYEREIQLTGLGLGLGLGIESYRI